MPPWLQRLVLFVALPAFCGALVAGTVFESETWMIVFFALAGGVLLLCILHDFSVEIIGGCSPVMGVIGLGIMALMVGLAVLFTPGPEPKNPLIFGCFANDKAPPIRIDGTGMQILQPGFPLIDFYMERGPDIAITLKQPIEPQPAPPNYRYATGEDGIGPYAQFYRLNGREASSFALTAGDGVDLWYDRVDAAYCEGKAKPAPPGAGRTVAEIPGSAPSS